ncbi:hypothetical protein LJC34_02775 [Oscillospiraceae bacterium OttesenSCG-928-G22]|nr:hypothetical protein [Oscillospiraceae bacterium OttesenSCG-928-G22]
MRTKHGQKGTRLYNIWKEIKKRTSNANNPAFDYYGGRGIAMCPDWEHDFKTFYEWALSNGYSEHLTIDREDNNGDYSPENCRWVTMKVQANNRRNNRVLSYHDETHTLAEWAEITGINYNTLKHRLRLGWPPERALTKGAA